MGDEAEQLAEAAKLPWEDRFVHKFWKARVVAYEAVVKEASLCETVDDSACLKAFGAFEIERASPRTRPDARGAVQILASTRPTNDSSNASPKRATSPRGRRLV